MSPKSRFLYQHVLGLYLLSPCSRLIATCLTRVSGKGTRADIRAPARAGGKNMICIEQFQRSEHFISKISAFTSSTESGPSPKRKQSAEDVLKIETVQQEGKSKARRDRIFAAGKSEGVAEAQRARI